MNSLLRFHYYVVVKLEENRMWLISKKIMDNQSKEHILDIVLRLSLLSSVPAACCLRLFLALGEAIMLKVAGREERSYRVVMMIMSQGS